MSLRTCLSLSNLKVRRLMFATFILGVSSAVIEYSFAITLQNFFQHLGLLKVSTVSFVTPSLEVSILILLITGFFKSLSEGLKIYLSRQSQQEFTTFTRLNLIKQTLHNATRHSSSKILALFSEETNRAGVSILNLSSLITHFTLGAILIIFCLITFTKATLIGIGLLIILGLPYRVFEKKIAKTGIQLSEEWERTNNVLVEGIRNNFYLKVIGRIDQEISMASKALYQHLSLFKKVFLLISTKISAPSFIGVIVLTTIGYIQHKYTLFGEDLRLLEFFYLFIRFTQSASTTGGLFSDFSLNVESTKRLRKWYDQNPIIISKINEEKISFNSPLELKIKDLSFGYDSKHLFQKLNLNLKTGDVLTIMGESGAGKSTLLALILGLIKPSTGEILLNNSSVFESQSSLTSLISYVGPHPFIIEGTIFDNLNYGSDKLTAHDPVIFKALEAACLKDFIINLPQGLNTRINEIGSQISTGQKQRLMIARALLRNPKILIMDEATANLDQQTESELIENLKAYLPELITIIVTHKNVFGPITTQNLILRKQD